MLFLVLISFQLSLELTTLQAATVRNYTTLRDRSLGVPPPTTAYSQDIVDVESQNQNTSVENFSDLKIYRGPLPKLPGTTISPWIALHSPVKMYIPIRYTDASSADSPSCVRCPKNLIAYLRRRQGRIQTPIPTISICPSFAAQPGRVHVAVVSGPKPGQRLAMGRHLVELVIWKADGLVHSCKYTITVRSSRSPRPKLVHKKEHPCSKPVQPENGMVLCIPEGDEQQHLPHDGVCQFFCLSGHLIQNTSLNSTVTICDNGRWSPSQDTINCVAALCELPSPPAHGSWNCEQETLVQGTLCKVSCEKGYVVPSHLLNKTTFLCHPPKWNISDATKLKCKRGYLPSLVGCHDRHIVVRRNFNTTLLEHRMPKGSTHDGRTLIPSCTLPQGKELSGGNYRNLCEVTDDELLTRKNCSYNIYVEETADLEPHPEDCVNRTIYINDSNDSASLIPARFLMKLSNPPVTKVTHSKCNLTNNITVGMHPVTCRAIDPATNISASCSFTLTVKVIPPKLIDGCTNVTVRVPSPANVTTPLPLFWNSNNETVSVSCVPPLITQLGSHKVICSTNISDVSCKYYININLDDHLPTSIPTSTPIPKTYNEENMLNTSTESESALDELKTISTFNNVTEKSTTESTLQLITSTTINVSNTSESAVSYTEKEVCETLPTPKHGILECSMREESEVCEVICSPGYGVPRHLGPYLVSCNNGVWIFPEDNITVSLPDCLAQMEGIAVEVWMSFEALAPQCDEDTEDVIEELIIELCPPGTKCRKESVNCTLDEESDTMLMSVKWVVEANFDQEGDNEEEVPEAETRLEDAMERARNFLFSGELPGITIFRDSFHKGFITLVCPEGFTPDMLRAKCVKCPDEDINVQCPPCGCINS